MYSRLGLWDETKGRWRMEGEEQVIYSAYVHLILGGHWASTHCCCPHKLVDFWASVSPNWQYDKVSGIRGSCFTFCNNSYVKKNRVKIMDLHWNESIACGLLSHLYPLALPYGRRPNFCYPLPIKTSCIESRECFCIHHHKLR